MSYEDVAQEDLLFPSLATDCMADHTEDPSYADGMDYGVAPAECLDCGEELEVIEPIDEEQEYCSSCWETRCKE